MHQNAALWGSCRPQSQFRLAGILFFGCERFKKKKKKPLLELKKINAGHQHFILFSQ